MKKIHVIMPVYNGEKFLMEAVNSVLCNKKENISIVLVNDGSTDSSGTLCDRLSEKYSQIEVLHQKNGGVSRARNAGIEYVLSKGITKADYFAFLDADDLWSLKANFDVIEFTHADIYAFSSLLIDNKKTLEKYMYKHADEVRQLPGANPGWLCLGHFGSCLYSAQMLQKYSLRFMPGVKITEDVIFWNQANFCAKTIVFSSDPLYLYRMNPDSVTHSKQKVDNAMSVPYAWNKAKEWVKPITHFSEDEKQKWDNKCSTILGPVMLEATQGLAEQGFSYQQIQNMVFDNPLSVYIDELDPASLEEPERGKLLLLRKNKKWFVRKFRLRGAVIHFTRMLLNFYPIRVLREWIRFRS